MGPWEHLFLAGEFMPRARLLSGLTLEQVSVRPPGTAHSIYDELWHTTKWQSTAGLDMNAEFDALQKEIQSIWDKAGGG